ncbi:MAG: alpha/beta fold hydrolase [Gammaproteobacteria bacterium]
MNLYYECSGKGEPIMILHGLFGSGRNWSAIAKILSQEFEVFVVDLRNHGKSPHAPTMSYSDMANDVNSLITKLSIAGLTLIGHSMGGKVAMKAALSKPDLIDELIIVDIAPVAYPDCYTDILNAINNMPDEKLCSRSSADSYLATRITDKATRQFILQNLIFVEGKLKWRLNVVALINEMKTIVGWEPAPAGSFPKPSSFVSGEHSSRVTDTNKAIIAAHFPGYNHYLVTGAGHWPHTEAPEEFVRILTNIVRGKNKKC